MLSISIEERRAAAKRKDRGVWLTREHDEKKVVGQWRRMGQWCSLF